jgi:CHAT domain-containing protein
MSPLGVAVTSLRTAIQNEEDERATQMLAALYTYLIAPVVAAGFEPEAFARWIVSPHGMLHAIPFAALTDEAGRRLVERVALVHAPSGAVWHAMQERARPAATSFLGLANPLRLDGVWRPLPEAEAEVEEICGSLANVDRTTYMLDEATEGAFRTEGAGKGILHFATHGEFPEAGVLDFHRVILAPDEVYDGRLQADELRALDLGAARLVALSICDGGIYRFGPGDEPYGLVRALLTAGVENVLGTLWPLKDEAGRALMVAFYRHLLDKGPAGALRQACREMMAEGASIRDWAGFVLVGVGRQIGG